MSDGAYVTTYNYDADGNIVTKTLPNGDIVATTYDALNRRTLITGTNPANVAKPTLYRYTYEHDTVGTVRKQIECLADFPTPISPEISTIKEFTYDKIYRLLSETDSVQPTIAYTYDAAHNQTSKQTGSVTRNYSFNSRNQLTDYIEGSKIVSYSYDLNGNRVERDEAGVKDTFGWDYENRLVSLTKQSPGGTGAYTWDYDYRTRRVELVHGGISTKVSFSGGTSVREFENNLPSVDYVRGSDWGGGVGGILYSKRGGVPSFTHYNGRGDVTSKTSAAGAITYQSSYEGFGQRTAEVGSTQDRQKSNTKDEDIPGYMNEGFRFRDLETGSFISRDPAGFIDGPNMYAYVMQNPWTKFDPEGLSWWSNALKGDFDSSETTWGGVVAQTVVGFVPVVGQIADLRDTGAAIKQLVNEPSFANTGNLVLAGVGWIPGVGDAAKGMIKGGKKVVAEGGQHAIKQADDVVSTSARRVATESTEVAAKKPDYTQIADPKNVDASTKPTVRQVREMKKMNMEANDGVLRDDVTGEVMVPSAKSQRGVTPPPNEVQVDHIVPVDKGGTRTMPNLELRTRANNRKKSNK